MTMPLVDLAMSGFILLEYLRVFEDVRERVGWGLSRVNLRRLNTFQRISRSIHDSKRPTHLSRNVS